MTVSEFQIALGLPELSPLFRDLFENVQEKLPELSAALLNESNICQIIEEYQLLTAYKQEVLEAVKEIKSNDLLSIYLCVIEKAMQMGRIVKFPVQTIPGTDAASRFGLALPLLVNIPNNAGFLRSRGITETMIKDTFYEFDRAVEVYSARANGEHRLPLSSFWWLQLIYENRLVRLGRLNMEMREFYGTIKAFCNTEGKNQTSGAGYIHSPQRKTSGCRAL